MIEVEPGKLAVDEAVRRVARDGRRRRWGGTPGRALGDGFGGTGVTRQQAVFGWLVHMAILQDGCAVPRGGGWRQARWPMARAKKSLAPSRCSAARSRCSEALTRVSAATSSDALAVLRASAAHARSRRLSSISSSAVFMAPSAQPRFGETALRRYPVQS